jgi:hypothetical protein
MEAAESKWAAFQNSYYFWDIITLACGVVSVFGFLALLIFMLGLPGRIAVARNHPDAEAVYALGWAGFLAVVPWIQAFIWAFKPTDIVDIRRFPDEEREAIKEDIARLKSYAYGKKQAPTDEETPSQSAPAPETDKEA